MASNGITWLQDLIAIDYHLLSCFEAFTDLCPSFTGPTDGYVAPPLDGIWASAPYFHNGSVPTLYEVLKSTARPEVWARTGISYDYNWEKIGWNYSTDPKGKDYRKWTFDTTVPGYGNGGHTFGDKLTEEERWAVVEYLKTL